MDSNTVVSDTASSFMNFPLYFLPYAHVLPLIFPYFSSLGTLRTQTRVTYMNSCLGTPPLDFLCHPSLAQIMVP